MHNSGVITLNKFIIDRQSDFPYSKGKLSRLLTHIGYAAKIVNKEINRAGIVDILGETGTLDTQEEITQTINQYSHETFTKAIKASGSCCGITSKGHAEIMEFDPETVQNAKYIVAIDPLDASSNIDVNVSCGTIFSIYKRITPRNQRAEEKDFLQEGTNLTASGYIIYGSSTMLIYTAGRGVNGFTLDPSIGEFCLSHKNIEIPVKGTVYSINEGNYMKFPAGVKKYLKYCQEHDKTTERPYLSRYIGSLVADFHRNLLKGGIFIYPESANHPNGKLKIIYECNPISFLAEQAGGKATDGRGARVMDIKPTSLSQKTPYYVGSISMVDFAEELIEKYNETNE